MSAVIKSGVADLTNNVFVFYNFKQVSDAVLVITYSDKTGSWEKLFVFNTIKGWDIETLHCHLTETKFNWIAKKLKLIFKQQNLDAQFEALTTDVEMLQQADFLLGLVAVD